MDPVERAQTYAAIFINAGARWPAYVPVDATVHRDVVEIGGVIMQPTVDGGWRLTTRDGRSWTVRPRDQQGVAS